MTINKSARRSHLMTSGSTRRILLEGFDSPLNEFKTCSRGQKENKEKNVKNSLSKGTALMTGASSGIGAVYADLPPHRSPSAVLRSQP